MAEELKSYFFCTYLWRTVKSSTNSLILIIELYHLMIKNQKLNFLLFLINILKRMCDFNIQWHLLFVKIFINIVLLLDAKNQNKK